MLDLSRVTCFAIDNTNRIEETIKALHTCKSVANFGEVKLVTTPEYVTKYKDELTLDGILVEEQVRPLTNIDEYNYYILYHLYLKTYLLEHYYLYEQYKAYNIVYLIYQYFFHSFHLLILHLHLFLLV